MSDFIRTLRTDRTTYFSRLPKDLVDLVAERVRLAVFEAGREKLILDKEKEAELRAIQDSALRDLQANRDSHAAGCVVS